MLVVFELDGRVLVAFDVVTRLARNDICVSDAIVLVPLDNADHNADEGT